MAPGQLVTRSRNRRAGRLAPVAALLGCVLLIGALVACAPGAAASGASGDFSGPVDIGGGRHLYVQCRGNGGPTVILESGYHDSSDPWSLTDATYPGSGPAVLAGLAATHRVCAYDRPGTVRYSDPIAITDRSTPAPMPRTAGDVVRDLHTMLDAARIPGPYLLVAHSLGGLFARLYAQTYPDQVRGVLFVDSFPIEIPAMMGAQWPAYQQLLDHPLPAFAHDPTLETIDIPTSVAQVKQAPALPPVPLAVLTKTEPFALPRTAPPGLGPALERAWVTGAQGLVALQPQTPHTFAAGSDHYIQVHQPDLVVNATQLLSQRAASPRR